MGIASILDSLGWAILHSTWQGALLALAVIMFRAATSDSQASLRCGFQVLCLLTALSAFFGTFIYYQFEALGAASSTLGTSLLGWGASETATGHEAIAGAGDVIATGSALQLETYIPIIGIVWIIGFVMLSIHYGTALVLTQQLRKKGLSPVPAHWQRRFTTLVLNSGIHRHVELFISNRVNGPITLGFFKPVVLVPASFFTGLPTEQVEAILLHEIAHIRRHDYLINLFQTAIRTVFFYHPAIHFISRRIDDDRERACDDFAVAHTRDPHTLAKGLAALRLSLAPRPFAMAATGSKSPLMARLDRLTGKTVSRRRPEHVVTSLAALIISAGLYTNYGPLANAHPENQPEMKAALHPSGEHGNYRFEGLKVDGRHYTIKISDDGSRWVNLDGLWYDIDHRPDILVEMPEIPVAPKAPTPEKPKFNFSQYKVDLDYYIASLENQIANGNKGVDLSKQLQKAQDERDSLVLPGKELHLDFKTEPAAEPVMPPLPDTIVTPVAAPQPARIIKASTVELAGPPPGLPSGIYIDGVHVESEDWPDHLETALEEALHEFEHQMEHIEERFDEALEVYEDKLDALEDNPNALEAKLARANQMLAGAALKANAARDTLTAKFDQEIQDLLTDADQYAELAQKLAEAKISDSIAELEHEIQTERFDSERDRREAEREFEREMSDLRRDLAEMKRESKLDHREVQREIENAMREAQQAEAEAVRETREWEREALREAEEALRDAKEIQREAQQKAYKKAEWKQKERDHVLNDFKEYREEMLDQLKDDGLISQSATSATISYPGKQMHVNGTPVPEDLEGEYCELNEEYHIHKNKNAEIRISEDGVKLKNSYFHFGQTHTTQWTYSDQ